MADKAKRFKTWSTASLKGVAQPGPGGPLRPLTSGEKNGIRDPAAPPVVARQAFATPKQPSKRPSGPTPAAASANTMSPLRNTGRAGRTRDIAATVGPLSPLASAAAAPATAAPSQVAIEAELGHSLLPPPPLEFDKMLSLFSNKMTADLVTRQADAVKKIVRDRQGGLYLPELQSVRDICERAMDALTRQPPVAVFVTPLCAAFRLHGLPFRSDKAYAELDYADTVVSSLCTIARGFRCGQSSLAIAAAETLGEFVDNVPTKMHYQMLAQSGVISFIVEALDDYRGDDSAAVAIMTLLRTLSSVELCAREIVRVNYHQVLPRVIATADFRTDIVDTALEVYWNLLELQPTAALSGLGDMTNVSVLSRLLSQFLTQGHRQEDKELRNQLLVIFSLLSRLPANRLAMARSDALPDILQHCTWSELNGVMISTRSVAPVDSAPPPVAAFTQTNSSEDIEMRQLMWRTVASLIPHPLCLDLIAKAHFLEALFVYLYSSSPTASTNGAVGKLAFTQLVDMQQQALAVLTDVAPYLSDQFIALDGLGRLLSFAIAIVTNPDESQERTLAADRLERLQSSALKCVLHALAPVIGTHSVITGDHPSEGAYHTIQEDVFHILIGLFTDTSRTLSVRSDAVAILSLLVKNNSVSQRAFRKCGGLKAIVAFLRSGGEVQAAMAKEPQLLFNVVDTVWCGIVGNKPNETHFLLMDGVDALLELLSLAPAVQRKQIISCLTDLMTNPEAKRYFHEWQIDSVGSTILPLPDVPPATLAHPQPDPVACPLPGTGWSPQRSCVQLLVNLWVEEHLRHADWSHKFVDGGACSRCGRKPVTDGTAAPSNDDDKRGVAWDRSVAARSRGARNAGAAAAPIIESDSDNDEEIDDVSVYHHSRPPALVDPNAPPAKKPRGGLAKGKAAGGGAASREVTAAVSPIDYSKVHLQQDKCSGVYTEFADSGGVILDVNHPLGATAASSAFIFDESATTMGRYDMRAAIYAFVSRVGFNALPYATHQQQMTLRLIEGYVAFRRGQVFAEMALELETDKDGTPLVPIEQDVQLITNSINAATQLAEQTQTFQRAQLAAEKEGEKKQLLAFLSTVEKRQQQDIMLPLQERGLLHQPSTMHARLLAREHRQTMLANSLDQTATLARTGGLYGPAAIRQSSFTSTPSQAAAAAAGNASRNEEKRSSSSSSRPSSPPAVAAASSSSSSSSSTGAPMAREPSLTVARATTLERRTAAAAPTSTTGAEILTI